MNEENKNFIKNYLEKLKEKGKKIDSSFIQDYLGTGATIEYFIYRELQKNYTEEDIEEILGLDTYKRVNEINNAYMNGIEGQDVSEYDFSGLSQAEFEMLRFDEDTKFSRDTIDEFHPEKILTRENTQIKNQTADGDKLHIAIIDVEGSTDNNYHGGTAQSIFSSINPNCEVHFYGVGSEDQDRAKAVQDIIDYNNECKDESKKIKLISCSHNLGNEEKGLIEEGNLKVISAGNLHGDFFEYFRFGDTDVVPQLTEEEGKAIEERYSHPAVSPIAKAFVDRFKSLDNAILVNVNLAIDQPTKRHECDISISWGVPIVAAYYAMALRANSDLSYDELRNICESSVKEGTRIFDEGKFIENIRELEQKIGQETLHQGTSKDKKRSLLQDYPEAIEGNLSYRLDLINESARAIRSDLVKETEKEQKNR